MNAPYSPLQPLHRDAMKTINDVLNMLIQKPTTDTYAILLLLL